MVDIHRDAKCQGIYLALLTHPPPPPPPPPPPHPEEESCFSIYQISWILTDLTNTNYIFSQKASNAAGKNSLQRNTEVVKFRRDDMPSNSNAI